MPAPPKTGCPVDASLDTGETNTPEFIYTNRRLLIKSGIAASAVIASGCGSEIEASGLELSTPESADGFSTAEELTTFEDATSYNNFYEFGTGKSDPASYASSLITQPWDIRVSGSKDSDGQFNLAELLKGLPLVSRTYRLRCVEGWSMVIPWQGVMLKDLLDRLNPDPSAGYVAFRTLADPKQMRGVRSRTLEWPYREGLRMDEATHPLTLLATGMYGKPLANQNGAPIRLLVPWKYGFKSIKSINDIRFQSSMPETSWNMSQPSEYGFYSNVNPGVDHPRWSQRSERRLSGTGSRIFASRIETRLFNGYDKQVAALYSGMDLKRWF